MSRWTAETFLVRFWNRVAIPESPDDCWIWLGFITEKGYGRLSLTCADGKRRHTAAHRFAWELANALPAPDDLPVDHLCRNRRCVNPAHLEPVTTRTNVLRGIAPPAHHSRKTHCIRGHALTPGNIYPNRLPHRVCITCARTWQARKAAATAGRSA